MWASLLAGILSNGGNSYNNKENAENEWENKQQSLRSNRMNTQQQQATVSGGHIDLDSIINGVFTKGKQQRNNSIPSGYLGV